MVGFAAGPNTYAGAEISGSAGADRAVGTDRHLGVLLTYLEVIESGG